MNPDVRAEKRRPPGGKQPPGHAPYSRVNQSDDRGSEKSQMTSSSKEQSDHGPFSIHQSENFPPEPGCDMSNPYYDLAVPSSSSSSYTVDSHWELLKVRVYSHLRFIRRELLTISKSALQIYQNDLQSSSY